MFLFTFTMNLSAQVTYATDQADELIIDKDTGEVISMRTPYMRAYMNADGSTTAEIYESPVFDNDKLVVGPNCEAYIYFSKLSIVTPFGYKLSDLELRLTDGEIKKDSIPTWAYQLTTITDEWDESTVFVWDRPEVDPTTLRSATHTSGGLFKYDVFDLFTRSDYNGFRIERNAQSSLGDIQFNSLNHPEATVRPKLIAIFTPKN